jgi:hypothetical protein
MNWFNVVLVLKPYLNLIKRNVSENREKVDSVKNWILYAPAPATSCCIWASDTGLFRSVVFKKYFLNEYYLSNCRLMRRLRLTRAPSSFVYIEKKHSIYKIFFRKKTRFPMLKKIIQNYIIYIILLYILSEIILSARERLVHQTSDRAGAKRRGSPAL